jgi:hypothetical protein
LRASLAQRSCYADEEANNHRRRTPSHVTFPTDFSPALQR